MQRREHFGTSKIMTWRESSGIGTGQVMTTHSSLEELTQFDETYAVVIFHIHVRPSIVIVIVIVIDVERE